MYRKVAFFWVKLPCETIGEETVGTCFYPDICKKLSRQRLIPLHCPFEKVGHYQSIWYFSLQVEEILRCIAAPDF